MTVFLPDENATSLMSPPPYKTFADEGADVDGALFLFLFSAGR